MSDASRSEPYQVVARRFRPATFEEVVGQEQILRSLRSSLASGRIPHALLFSGSRGVGKTTLARIFARALNCEQGPTPEPCGQCAPCRSILDGTSTDIVEIDAASHNRVDDIRELRGKVGFATMGGRYKVYILDEAHMITRNAWNAFLKTLEEPPPNVIFVMATTELHRVPETIVSRCQVHHFRRVGEEDIRRRLRMIADAESVSIADDVLTEIAAQSRGGMRDAETALERILPVARELDDSFDLQTYRGIVHRVGADAVLDVLESMFRAEVGPALRFAAELVDSGVDEREALGEVLEVLRSLLLMVVDGPETGLVAGGGASRERLQRLARSVPVERIEAMIQAGLVGRDRLRRLEDRRLVLELTFLRMVSAGDLPLLGELVAAARGGDAALGAEPSASPSTPGVARSGAAKSDLRTRLLERLAQDKPMLARTVEQCTVSGPDADGVVTLELKNGRRMLRDRLAAPGVQQDLKVILADLLEGPVALKVELEAGKEEPPPPPPAKRRQPGATTRKVMERFDGRIVDLDDGSKNQS